MKNAARRVAQGMVFAAALIAQTPRPAHSQVPSFPRQEAPKKRASCMAIHGWHSDWCVAAYDKDFVTSDSRTRLLPESSSERKLWKSAAEPAELRDAVKGSSTGTRTARSGKRSAAKSGKRVRKDLLRREF